MDIRSFEFDGTWKEPFIEFPWRVYAGDERWIPPFKDEVREALSRQNPFFAHGEIRNFVAVEGEEVLARASAILNRDLRHEGEAIGLVGYFETLDRYDAAEAVLDAGVAWLKGKGLRTVWGPMNFSIWHSYRFMTRGHDRDVFYGEPYNPPRYPEFFVRYGFEPLARYYSWDLEEAALRGILGAAQKMKVQSLIDAGYRTAPFRLDEFDEELKRLYSLLMDGFQDNLGYSPIGLAEFQSIFGGLKHLVLPDLVPIILDPQGNPAGFAYLYPDIGPAIREMNGERGLLARLRFMMTRTKARQIVSHTMVVREEYRGKGLVETFLGPLVQNILDHGFTRAIGALAKEGPTIYAKTGPSTREYTLYRLGL